MDPLSITAAMIPSSIGQDRLGRTFRPNSQNNDGSEDPVDAGEQASTLVRAPSSSKPQIIKCHVKGCSSVFNRDKDLQRHLKEYHAPLLRCPVPGCNFSSKRQQRINKHVNVKHPSIKPRVELSSSSIVSTFWTCCSCQMLFILTDLYLQCLECHHKRCSSCPIKLQNSSFEEEAVTSSKSLKVLSKEKRTGSAADDLNNFELDQETNVKGEKEVSMCSLEKSSMQDPPLDVAEVQETSRFKSSSGRAAGSSAHTLHDPKPEDIVGLGSWTHDNKSFLENASDLVLSAEDYLGERSKASLHAMNTSPNGGRHAHTPKISEGSFNYRYNAEAPPHNFLSLWPPSLEDSLSWISSESLGNLKSQINHVRPPTVDQYPPAETVPKEQIACEELRNPRSNLRDDQGLLWDKKLGSSLGQNDATNADGQAPADIGHKDLELVTFRFYQGQGQRISNVEIVFINLGVRDVLGGLSVVLDANADLVLAGKYADFAVALDKDQEYQKAREAYAGVCKSLITIKKSYVWARSGTAVLNTPPRIDLVVKLYQKRSEELLLLISPTQLNNAIKVENDDDNTYDASETASSSSMLNSNFSNNAGSSMTSAMTIPAEASERLVQLLLEDFEIRSLCVQGLSGVFADKFEKKFRQLLRELALGLRKEARTSEEREAAYFVRIRSRNTAYIVCSTLNQHELENTGKKQEGLPDPRAIQRTGTQDEISDQSSGSESDEELINNFQQLEIFVSSSKAMYFFRERLKTLILQASNSRFSSAPTQNEIIDTAKVIHGDLSGIDRGYTVSQTVSSDFEEKTFLGDKQNMTFLQKANWVFSHCSNLLSIRSYETRNNLVLIAQLVVQSFRERLPDHMPPIQPGKTRVEITCKCGKVVLDDFLEISPTGAERYRAGLQRFIGSNRSADHEAGAGRGLIASRERWGLSYWSPSGDPSIGQRIDAAVPPFGSLFRYLVFPIFPGLLIETARRIYLAEQAESEASKNSASGSSPSSTLPKNSRNLLSRLNNALGNFHRYATRLLQPEAHSSVTNCDQSFFNLLSSAFKTTTSKRGRLQAIFSLKRLDCIKFVQFELYQSDLVDIRKCDDIPPDSHVDYKYLPTPMDVIPPIGENLMMHLFNNPSHASSLPHLLPRVPRKVRDKLLFHPANSIRPSWGLQFVENWNFKLLWILSFILFGGGSLLFGVLWSVYKKSVQDAFAVSAYVVTTVGVFGGAGQAILLM